MYVLSLADLSALLERFGVHQLKEKVDQYILGYGPQLLSRLAAAGLIFLVGRWAAGIAEDLLQKVLSRAHVDETLSKFLCRLLNALLLCAIVLAALEQLGVNTTSLAAVLAAAGLAIGMALQGSLSNFAAGVMIILFRPFKVGDFIEAGGTKGIVEEIHIFSTMMRTGDNVKIIVPNSSVTGGNISNYSEKPTRRIDLIVGCGYQDDLREVKQFLEALVAEDPRILSQPKPDIAVSQLADHCVEFIVRPWVKNVDYWAVRWDLLEKIKLGFDERGFHIPFPQRDVHVHTSVQPRSEDLPPTVRLPQHGEAGSMELLRDPQRPRRVG